MLPLNLPLTLDKVLKLKDLEDEIFNAEESINKLKEQARILSQVEIPIMMQEMHITKHRT